MEEGRFAGTALREKPVRRRLLALLLVMIAGVLMAEPADLPTHAALAATEAIAIDAFPVVADGEALPQPATGGLQLLAAFELRSAAKSWGGLSGASIAPDGSVLTVVADIGLWYRITLRHDRDGRLTGIAGAERDRLKDEQGKPLGKKSVGDAESIARGADGSYYVTFEGWHRLWRYAKASDPLQAAAKFVRAPKAMASLPGNEGVEASAVLPDGRFLLLSETSRTNAGDLQGWLGDGKGWADVALAPTGAFKPTDLAVLPSGDLLLLERSLSMFGGFAARLSVIPAATIAPGARLSGRELAVIKSPLPVDNFEALAARAAPDGSVLIYVLSDDNFSDLERTLLLQFRWPP